MKQKFLTLLLAVFMMVAALSMNSEAAETEESPVLERMEAFTEASVFAAAEEQVELYDYGYCNDNVVWGITPDGILIITTENSRGTMPDYSSQSAPWDIYEEYIWFVIIDGTIDNVSAKAFDDFDSLEYVYLYDGVKKIDSRAFASCDYLVEVELPDTITAIGKSAFEYCGRLTAINLPKKLTSIGEYAFSQSGLKNVTIPGGVTKIEKYAFSSCDNLTSVTVSNGVKGIGQFAFSRNDNLTSVNLANSISKIERYAFCECGKLASVNIPTSLTVIDEGTFAKCGIKNITIPSSVTEVKNYAFSCCENLTSVKMPNQITKIEEGIFNECSNLKEVDLPDYMTLIPTRMFYNCKNLKAIEIPSQVTAIQSEAFSNCSGLKTVRIPVSVRTIEYKAFAGCGNLNTVFVMNENANFGTEVFKNTGSNLLIRCHEKSTAQIYAMQNWHAYEFLDMSKVTDCFADVAEGKWFVNSVQYVFDKELMSGSGEYFNPTKNVTRAQLVTTLYRLAGSPEVTDYSACKAFSDVEEGKYYTDAICWAYNEGIATGNDGKFNTTGNLTRQQMAAFFFRFADVMEYDVTDSADFSEMLNADKVSDYAVDAVSWAVGAGLISGSETKDEAGNVVYDLNPRGNTTRAQLSAILQRFCEGFVFVERPEPTPEVTPTPEPTPDPTPEVTPEPTPEPSDGDELPGVPIS